MISCVSAAVFRFTEVKPPMTPNDDVPDDGLGCARGIVNALPVAVICWAIVFCIGCPRIGHAEDVPRPSSLTPLELSLCTLQGLDLWTTQKALSGGARESNQIMVPVVGSSAASIAVKAAATAGAIAVSEQWRKGHPKVAVLFMLGANVAMSAVVAHNVGVIRQQRPR